MLREEQRLYSRPPKRASFAAHATLGDVFGMLLALEGCVLPHSPSMTAIDTLMSPFIELLCEACLPAHVEQCKQCCCGVRKHTCFLDKLKINSALVVVP